MADSNAQLEALKDAARSYQSRIQLASTKDEALNLAIDAADSLMQATKLSHDPQEVKDLKAQCSAIITAATNIKSSQNWKPAPPLSLVHDKGKNADIDRWAADVAKSVEPTTTHEFPRSVRSKSPSHNAGLLVSTMKTTTPAMNGQVSAPITKGNSSPALSAYENAQYVVGSQGVRKVDGHSGNGGFGGHGGVGERGGLGGLGDLGGLDDFSEGGVELGNTDDQHFSRPGTDIQGNPAKASSASNALHGKSETTVRRLKEPVSTREMAKKEQIILLRASVVNGFKFKPWDKPPTSEEFALEGDGLFVDKRDLALSPYQMQFFSGWERATKALPPASLFPNNRNGLGPVMGASRTIDLVQDAATDCSVVASLCAAIARAERGHDQMLSNMISPFDKNLGKPVLSANGRYIVRLNFNGCWRKVEIDDRLPVSSSHRLLHVIDRKNPALLWPALLEKAYLKVRGGYDFPGSNSCSDLWTFTGWIPEQIYLQETDTVPSQLWKRVYKAFLYGDVLVTVGTGKMSTKQERELGLEGQHSYVVLDMKETDHDRLILVKNPWVEGKGWRGPRPITAPVVNTSTSSASTSRSVEVYNMESVPSKDRPHPTTFWISLDHVIQHFESLYLNWNPGLFHNRQDIHFEWGIESQESSNDCIVNNPQFAFHTREKDVVFLLLNRHLRGNSGGPRDESDAFLDGTARPESQVGSSGELLKGFMSIYVCDGRGERLYIKKTYRECGPYVNTTQSLLRWYSDPDSTYTIVIDQDELPASKYTFTLSAFSNSAITLEPAVRTYPHQKVERGEWTTRTAGGSTSSPRYFENPQYSLEVHTRCDLAIMLNSKHAHPMHVKLTLGFGKRMYKLQSRDVFADSEEHRARCVFAEAKDVPPGLYTIVCSLFEADKTGDFELWVDSTSPVSLKQIPRDGAGLIPRTLAKAVFGAQMHKLAANLHPHRLASYTIVARFLQATSPRSRNLSMLARSPFRLSLECGRGPRRKFLMTSERGEYSDSTIVRSDPVTLVPGVEKDQIHLVLERLSSPGGPIEEWYEVEIFTDAPQDAYSVGVWREWDD
ncbi:hypothetical protein BDV96DRAFT_508599 [Lophiotrema nucula]|uniref:Calpain catalytic domain-containing protein n=1 Tax=Lophiotrema nucula TaxID=690887 RepID=A0A6A5YF83_9PLEO|nr:hypothetical protein BDV96DRAFT_508599 [Lophiotrema nucula]